jgi:hypothetical protein
MLHKPGKVGVATRNQQRRLWFGDDDLGGRFRVRRHLDGPRPRQETAKPGNAGHADWRTEEFKNHVEIGLRNGLTAGEIEEALIQATAYAGFPEARAASNAAA